MTNTNRKPKIPVVEKVIEIAGGPSALGALLGITPSHVINWRYRGIPPTRCAAIEAALDGQVSCHEMRPDVFPAPKEAAGA